MFCVIGLFIFLIEIEVFFVENVDDLDVMDVDLQGLQENILKIAESVYRYVTLYFSKNFSSKFYYFNLFKTII